MKKSINLSEMPRSWQVCFNHECPQCADCLRFYAGRQVSEQREWGPAIYPSALKDGRCDYFTSVTPVLSATGFTHLFDKVNALHVAAMRRELKEYLGGNGTYYLYRNGRKFLSPQQMEWIDDLFKRYGYGETGTFDRHEVTLHY